MLRSVLRLLCKTGLVTPDYFYVFNLILSLSTSSQSLKKKSVHGKFWARTSLTSTVNSDLFFFFFMYLLRTRKNSGNEME